MSYLGTIAIVTKTFLFFHGTMKCGTTWLSRNLEESSDFFGGGIKEWRFWPSYFSLAIREQRLRDLEGVDTPEAVFRREALAKPDEFVDRLARKTQRSSKLRVLGDLTPSIGLSADQLQKLSTLMNQYELMPKGLLLMRDPVDRVFSELSMKIRNRRKGFEVDMDAPLHIRQSQIDRVLRTNCEAIFERSRYEKLILGLVDLESRVDSRTIFYENMFSQDSLDDIANFIGIVPPKINRKVIAGGRRVQPNAESMQFVAEQVRSTYEFFENSNDYGPLPEAWTKSHESWL